MTKEDSRRVADVSPKKDSRDAVESAISGAKGDRGVTWEVSIARTNKKVGRWDETVGTARRKRSEADTEAT